MTFTVKSKLAFAIGAVALLPLLSNAETGEVELGAGASYFLFDNDLDLSDKFGLRLLAGTRFSERWGLELVYDKVNTEFDTGGDFDITQMYINAMFYGNKIGNMEPYLSAGWGQASYETSVVDNDSTLTNFGGGAKFYLADQWVLRPSVNYFLPTELDDGYASFSLTLSYLINSGRKTTRTVAGPLDSDGDGIRDSADNCPSTPVGIVVDVVGCPLDTDLDGVFDYADQCPGTAAKLKVDEQGCPIVLKETVAIDLSVNFDTNSDVVKPEYLEEIKGVATFLEQYENTAVVIEGHTDTRGNAAYNKALSQKRADAVAKVLVTQFGVDAKRVRAIGYGEEQPIADDSTREGQNANRRVVAKVSATVESELRK